MNFEEELKVHLKAKLKIFDNLDLNDEMVVIGINAAAVGSILEAQDHHTGFDGDVYFDYDPDPYLKLSWWHGMTGAGKDIIMRFRPLRFEEEDGTDYLAAYERAMSIL